MTNKALIPLVLALLVQSCSRPLSYESFIKNSDAGAGVYEFAMDLSDTTGVYDIYLFARVDRSRLLGRESRVPQKLEMKWISPSKKVWDESVYMNMGDYRGVRQLYRKGIVPSEDGQWILQIRPEELPPAFRGMGVICEKNGTR